MRFSSKLLTFCFFVCLSLANVQSAYAVNTICYVNNKAAGTNSGASWANAYTTLQAALQNSACTELWVAKGSYYPDEGPGLTNNNRSHSFVLRTGLGVYGGFAGTETLRTQRDWVANVTILSGDIDKNDSQQPIAVDIGTLSGNDNNTYHVVTGATGATLDGFTVTAGSGVQSTGRGGGILLDHANATLSHLVVTGNRAWSGGGIGVTYCAATLSFVVVTQNKSDTWGGRSLWRRSVSQDHRLDLLQQLCGLVRRRGGHRQPLGRNVPSPDGPPDFHGQLR